MFILVRKLICRCKQKNYILLDGVPLQRKIHFSINKFNGIKLIFEEKKTRLNTNFCWEEKAEQWYLSITKKSFIF